MIQVFKEIQVGGISRAQLIGQLISAGMQFNNYANLLFEHASFQPEVNVNTVKTVKVHVSDLKIQGPCSYEVILQKAGDLGLKPCSLDLAAFLRLHYLDQPEGPFLLYQILL